LVTRPKNTADSQSSIACALIFAVALACVLVTLGCSQVEKPPVAEATPAILLFDGAGTSPNDVAEIARILREQQLAFVRADSERLNATNEDQLRAFRLIIVPGGNSKRWATD
jgi:hypothetical protein